MPFKILKSKKLSETPFRKEVLNIFLKHDHAIPLSIIEQELDNYNRITLYRTIKIFIEKGVIHEITISGQDSHFAICKDECSSKQHQHQHIHFKCTQCETISCVETKQLPQVLLPEYVIEQIEIQASGICKNCS